MPQTFTKYFFLPFLLNFFDLSQAQMLSIGVWQQQLNLTFTTSAQSILNKNCSGVVTVRANRGVNNAYTQTSSLTVNLSGPLNLTFYSDNTCAIPVTTITIPIGASSANFYFIDTVNASAAVTASAVNYRPISQTHTLATNGFVWTGALSTVWSTNGNWSGGVAPGASDVAVFDGSCSMNCSPTFTGAVNVLALRMSAGYTGTIVQDTFDITLGSRGFMQIAGTFTGTTNGAAFLNVNNGPATVAGGTFTAPTGFMRLSNSWKVLNAPTMNFPAGSTLQMRCTSSGWLCSSSTVAFQSNAVAYANVIFEGRSTSYDLNSEVVTITEDLLFGDVNTNGAILSGTLNVAGDITQNLNGSTGSSSVVVATGNPAGQTITGLSGSRFLMLEIAAGIHPITLSGSVRTRKYTYTSSGVFTAAGSTLELTCANGYTDCDYTTVNISLGNVVYGNVVFNGYGTNYNLGGGTLTVAENFTFGDQTTTASSINNGAINVAGDITAIDNGYNSTGTGVVLTATGNALGQVITGLATKPFLILEINTGVHPVTLAGSIITRRYAWISSGAFTAAGSTLAISCSNGAFCESTTQSIPMGSVTYNNLSISGYTTSYDLGGTAPIVSGNFTFGDQSSTVRAINNGTINVQGNITAAIHGYTGTALVIATGNASGQTLTGIAAKNFLPIQINTGLHPITLSGTLRTRKYDVISVGTVTTTGSTLQFYCIAGYTDCTSTTYTLALGSATYNNLTFGGNSTTWDLNGATIAVNGNFTFGDLTGAISMNNGTFNVGGNVTVTNNGYRGTAQIVLTGNASGQTITGVSGVRMPPLRIDTGANPVTLSGSIRTHSYIVTSVGTMTTTGSTLDIRCESGIACDNTTVALSPGSATYNNVFIRGFRTAWDLGGATFNIGGNLTFTDFSSSVTGRIENGILSVATNVTVTTPGNGGNAALHFVGPNPQRISSGFTMPSGSVVVNKTNTLLFLTNVTWNTAGQDMTITAGTVDMGGFNLVVNDVLTIDPGAILTQNLGGLTHGSLVNNGTLNP